MTQFPQLSTEVAANEKLVTMKTTMGDIKLKLFPDLAPKTVENFLGLAAKGYYDGIIFHRVIPDFMIQGGDPTGTGMGGESLWGEEFNDEFSKQAFNLNGALSMANAGPNTNGSQFFIVSNTEVPQNMLTQLEGAGYEKEVIDAYAKNGGTPWLDFRHTVFGHVIEGMDVVYDIQNVKRGAQDKPVNGVRIESIEIAD
ncbi:MULTISPECIES: peptidylprolyl isomerase [Carnobacterium]|jgi:peptidyl-prolyl cis-trans isomerase B (cyclophilin B)|uniref:Peptidyl-prolyl cis-trans isomerase n=2 Tax=Carnobacterium maltaromaticum TaxID=2751 RepID=K8E2U8_CARML|nr:peptidylprolyl isomerase [Carnobacterium maltaromaticum]AOA01433.1 peptidylprolyl isomerase [Carnobacterium maltaromaticum]KRN60353.1 peptidyl-prolyl isomerase [Carnobacterium maltaromaticum DSM 20342]KRN73862.1 peptidyl-prolyl isomerase [Carnobacterium maltaromaticum]KRN85178.1 peptidyl-prolyl isomerase [Carnobacterium maltaromaticum]MBC9788932.1 peptidylprolyl isomerase [Carnobacterium maltaromaticum]